MFCCYSIWSAPGGKGPRGIWGLLRIDPAEDSEDKHGRHHPRSRPFLGGLSIGDRQGERTLSSPSAFSKNCANATSYSRAHPPRPSPPCRGIYLLDVLRTVIGPRTVNSGACCYHRWQTVPRPVGQQVLVLVPPFEEMSPHHAMPTYCTRRFALALCSNCPPRLHAHVCTRARACPAGRGYSSHGHGESL